jgi:glycosyltransferase involved in cell wall biosynthesis
MTDNSKLTKKQKIVLLTWEFPPNIVGGLARHVAGLSRSLAKGSCEVYVVTAKTPNCPDYEVVNNVHVYRVSPLHEQEPNFLTWIAGLNLAMVTKAIKLFERQPPDLIHAHDWLVGSAAITLKKVLNAPMFATIHSTENGRNNGIYTETQTFIHEKERQLIDAADRIIVCSEYMKNEIGNLFSKNPDELAVIANGVDNEAVQTVQNDILSGVPIDPNRRLIFSIGRIVKEKGFDTIIDSVPALLNNHPDLYFIIAGKGPMLDEYHRLIIEKGLQNHIYFIGFVSDALKAQLFNKCELAIFPSLYEPFGIVALESMVFGKPTIVAKTGGLSGIIDDRKTGLFMTPGDSDSLIEQVEFLLNNQEQSKKLAENAKTMVLKNYSWDKIAEVTKKIYEDYLCKVK